MRNGENRNYRFVPFLTGAKQKMPKKSKKIKKIEKYHYGMILSQNSFGKGQEREKLKIIVSFRSYLMRYRKFQKKSKKIKKKKNTIMASFQAKIG